MAGTSGEDGKRLDGGLEEIYCDEEAEVLLRSDEAEGGRLTTVE